MNKGAIDRLLRSTPWKVVATLLLLVLTYAVVQLVVTAYHALKFYEHYVAWGSTAPTARGSSKLTLVPTPA